MSSNNSKNIGCQNIIREIDFILDLRIFIIKRYLMCYLDNSNTEKYKINYKIN